MKMFHVDDVNAQQLHNKFYIHFTDITYKQMTLDVQMSGCIHSFGPTAFQRNICVRLFSAFRAQSTLTERRRSLGNTYVSFTSLEFLATR